MAKYLVTWEVIQTGTSEVEAKDLQDAKEKAENIEIDFGDPKQFTPNIWEDLYGWEIESIEEILE